MRNLRSKLATFFRGRYGIDSFGYFLFIVYAVLCIINAFFGFISVQLITLLLAVYSIWRMMSRNFWKRSRENQKFLNAKKSVQTEVKLLFDRIKYIKTARFRKCKHCRAIIKLPNKRGKHTVKCPKCGKRFDVNLL